MNFFSKLRSVGVKSADELYKGVNLAVRESGELRCTHEATTRELKEACGLQPVSNIKQVKKICKLLYFEFKFFKGYATFGIKEDTNQILHY